MRLSFVLALCVLTAGTAQATPTFSVDELPLPFGGEVDRLRLSANGTVAGCMERGVGDWLPFAWDPARGLQLIDVGTVGDRYRCLIAGVTDDGLIAGRLPGSTWYLSVAFVWSDTRGLLLFDDLFSPAMLFNTAGQLVLLEYGSRLVVWTEAEGRFEIDLDDYSVESFRQNEAGMLSGVLELPPDKWLFAWSRERGLETFLKHVYDYNSIGPSIERFSEDGWAAGYLADSTPPFGDVAYVRAPDGTIHPFSIGEGIDMYELGSDGLIVGSVYDAGAHFPFAFQPGFGVELLNPARSPYSSFDAANDVNASNVVVGRFTEGYHTQAFIWERSEGIKRLGLGGPTSFGGRINDEGWVIGDGVNLQNQHHPFLWSPGTGYFELSWGNDHGYHTHATGLNASGTVIGWGEEAPNVDRPFIFMPRFRHARPARVAAAAGGRQRLPLRAEGHGQADDPRRLARRRASALLPAEPCGRERRFALSEGAFLPIRHRRPATCG